MHRRGTRRGVEEGDGCGDNSDNGDVANVTRRLERSLHLRLLLLFSYFSDGGSLPGCDEVLEAGGGGRAGCRGLRNVALGVKDADESLVLHKKCWMLRDGERERERIFSTYIDRII